MSKEPNRRFPRTARAMPEAPPTIEREKIRHRRPNDLLFDGGEHAVAGTPDPAVIDQGESYGDEFRFDETVENDWSEQDSFVSETTDWDDESEGDWVLNRDEDPAPRKRRDEIYVEDRAGPVEDDVYVDELDDGGVVWEDEAYTDEQSFQDSDELSFGEQGEDVEYAPEVELAGRRDISPKPPRPAPPPRSQRPRQQRAPSARKPDAIEDEFAPQQQPPPQSARPPMADASGDSRFLRTRANLGPVAGAAGSVAARAFSRGDDADEQVLQKPRPDMPQRRRQKPAAPAALHRASRRHPSRRSKGGISKLLVLVLVFLLVGGGGWFAYQSFGGSVQPIIDRVAALLPFGVSSRTAADTSFGNQQSDDAIAAQQALSKLEDSVRRQNGAAANGVDPATNRVDGPPIPKFKPLPGTALTRSLASPAEDIDSAQLAANDGESSDGVAGEPSIFQQIWRYLSPG